MPPADPFHGPTTAVPFDTMPMARALADDGLTVTGWSRAAAELFGRPAADVLGQPLTALLADGHPVPELSAVEDGVVLRAVHGDGRVLTLGVHATALDGPGGRRMWSLAAIDLATAPWWRSSHSALERFLSDSPYGIAVLDTELRYVWGNRTLERIAGVPNAARVGRRMAEILPELGSEAVDEVMRHVLRTGQPVLDFEYRGRVPADPGRDRVFSAGYLRLDDDRGRTLGLCYMGIDVTDRVRTRERLVLLTESGARIGSTLDFTTTARELADVVVSRLADFAAVDLLETVLAGGEPDPGAAVGRLRRVAHGAAGPDGIRPVAAVGGEPRYHPDSPMAAALATGSAVLENHLLPWPPWLAADLSRQPAVTSGAASAVLALPIGARGAVLGVVVLLRGEPFEPDDVALAEELVSRAAVCLDNARRFAREHRTALALQRSLLPPVLPSGPTLEIAHRYLPAATAGEVGGKWFDVIPLPGARTALVVGEVAGRGIDAAAAMGRLRTAVHTLADQDLAPDELLAHLDDLVLRLGEERAHQPHGGAAAAAQGATCLYLVHDPATGRCTAASAGHPGPILARPGDQAVRLGLPPGPPLGEGSLPFETAALDLPEGTVLALTTRAARPDQGGRPLPDAVSAADPPELVCDRLVRALPPVPQEDVALLVARTGRIAPDRIATWDLESDPTEVSRARLLAARQLDAWQLQELAFTTELAVSELVTNALRYGRPPISLRLIRQASLICEVSDGASSSPRLRHARTTDEGGRGLFILAQLTRRWGTRYTDTGKIIWCEQPLPETAPG
ncbi:SpoIIE family protein phosphatase [Kitasatospora terrestris]|uniref:SpoIIE family protein phosphatase n=1 Tax=Kitasatospora terrestris TaxID=258051 RepID=A0ABP9DAS1_9ACTN